MKATRSRTVVSCLGDVSYTRPCGYCRACRQSVTAVDAWAGMGRDALTPEATRLAALSGSMMSFDRSSESLRAFCGLKISDQTIRRVCDRVGREAKAYLEHDAQATAAVAAAPGQAECTMDGAKVNTVEGWREIRAVVLCKREPGPSRGIRHWRDRKLPAPKARVAWAGIADSDAVGQRLHEMAHRLNWGQGEGVSLTADGIGWIWKQGQRHLPDHEGCLDIWHVMEHLHAAGRVLHGEGEAARKWAEQQRQRLFRLGAKGYLKKELAPQVREARDRAADSEAAGCLTSLLGYLWKHRGRMDYRGRLRRGLPIGSGQIEGVCKNTLNRRLRKNSPRWRPERAEHIAALCCLDTSRQWNDFWRQRPTSPAA